MKWTQYLNCRTTRRKMIKFSWWTADASSHESLCSHRTATELFIIFCATERDRPRATYKVSPHSTTQQFTFFILYSSYAFVFATIFFYQHVKYFAVCILCRSRSVTVSVSCTHSFVHVHNSSLWHYRCRPLEVVHNK